MPAGAEDDARAFFGGVLGMREVDKPPVLAQRGGVWFRRDGLELHLGVEEPFSPARKAHPGIVTTGLDRLAAALRAAGHHVETDAELPGFRRFYVHDCFGNRLEFLEPDHDGAEPPVLTTARLVLRPLRVEDVDAVLACVDEDFARFVPSVPWPYTREDAIDFVDGAVARDPTTRPEFAIEHGGRLIGVCSLSVDRDAATAGLGYGLARDARGAGLAPEAATRLLEHAFGDLGVEVVWASAHAGNIASHRVLEKVGMTLDGVLRGRRVRFGERHDEHHYSVLRSEWEAGPRRAGPVDP